MQHGQSGRGFGARGGGGVRAGHVLEVEVDAAHGANALPPGHARRHSLRIGSHGHVRGAAAAFRSFLA